MGRFVTLLFIIYSFSCSSQENLRIGKSHPSIESTQSANFSESIKYEITSEEDGDTVKVKYPSGQCYVDISIQLTDSIAHFFPKNSSSPYPILSYKWLFGDGDSSSLQNPIHTYKTYGVFRVELTIEDSSGCYYTASGFLQVDCGPFTNTVPQLKITMDSINLIMINKNHNPNQTGKWYIQNDVKDLSKQQSFEIDYNDTITVSGLTPGYYYSQLYIEDTLQNCAQIIYPTFIIPGNEKLCDADFAYSSIQGLNISFQNTSIPTYFTSYDWDFGDSTNSTKKSPNHIYMFPDNYKVTLRIHDTIFRCRDTVSKWVNFSPTPRIGGAVYYYKNFSYHAPLCKVYLIDGDTSKTNCQIYSIIDSVTTNSFYEFSNLDSGNYFVKAKSIDTSFADFHLMPTYYFNDILWQNSASIHLTSPINSIDIFLKNGKETQGSNKLEGELVNQSKNSNHLAIKNKTIFLLDSAYNPIQVTTTNSLGLFTFNNLPSGNYIVFADIPGLISIPNYIDIVEGRNAHLKLAVRNKKIIELSSLTSAESLKENSFSIYPNPANNFIYLRNRDSKTNFKIISIEGKVVHYGRINNNYGLIDLKSLSKGLYFLQLNNNPIVETFVKE